MRSIKSCMLGSSTQYRESEEFIRFLTCIDVFMAGFRARLIDLQHAGWEISYDKDLFRRQILLSCRHRESNLTFCATICESAIYVYELGRPGAPSYPIHVPLLKPKPEEVERDYTVLELLEKAERKLDRQL